MNNGGDAAEQIVRLSLEGFEVAARLSEEYRYSVSFRAEAGDQPVE